MEAPIPSSLVDALKKQKYHFVGRHSAVKRCRWLYETLIHDRPCYKQKFYGIKTHRCIQMTPSLYYCTQQCLFCWRAQNSDLQVKWDEMRLPTWDSPETIVEESIRAHCKILTGYKGNPKADKKKLEEAAIPRHAAISLAGEPTLYAGLEGLIHAFHMKGFTTFLVTNGTVPTALAKLREEPTQLYVSVCASEEKTYNRVCRPQTSKAWEKLNETLSFLSSFKCPTVMRMTLARGVNMENIKSYAKLVEKACPTYVEPKAYMHVGFSRLRLNFENMPSHEEIREFAAQLAKETSYSVLDEAEESRVVLLSKLEKPRRLGNC
ncbi:MAG TPA: 4-demethylwyosine synthase TYW1 [Candidatus Bathyarchaeia archaeon]|nr:4-demethylwyosine synthase TYW1 [Candidatus Bathyarchaeia archaeon]